MLRPMLSGMLSSSFATGGDAEAFAPTSISFPSSSPPRWSLVSALGADSATATVTWWEKPDATSTSATYIFGDNVTSTGFRAASTESATIRRIFAQFFQNSSNSLTFATATTPALAEGEWNFVAISVSIATGQGNICVINNSGVTTATTVSVNGSPTTITFTGTSWVVGTINASGSAPYFGELAEITVHRDTGLIDFSSAANRRLFITEDGPGGVPVNLGSDGSTPFGTAALVYMTGADASSWNNVGSAGSFTLTGTATGGSSIVIPFSGVAWDGGATWDSGVLWS